MKIVVIIARILLGASLSPSARMHSCTSSPSGYLRVLQAVCGRNVPLPSHPLHERQRVDSRRLVAGKPLSSVRLDHILAPIIVNILMFHILLPPVGWQPGVLAAIL